MKGPLACQGLQKSYPDSTGSVAVLSQLDFTLSPGEKVAIVGSSGSGKSTLLHLLSGLDLPTAGSVWLQGKDITLLSVAKRAALRRDYVGFVYQFHHLLPELTALENVALPLLLGSMPLAAVKKEAMAMLTKIGLHDRADHLPAMLSGGECQRVAIARAVIHRPTVVLADEPTGNLDGALAAEVADLLFTIVKTHGTSLVVVTHDLTLAQQHDRVLTLRDGRLSG